MHSGITGWNARASCTVYRNLPRPHLDQGISGRILDAFHTLGFMQICFLHARSLSAAPALVGTASKDPGRRLRRRVWQARIRNRTTKSHFFEEQLKKKALMRLLATTLMQSLSSAGFRGFQVGWQHATKHTSSIFGILDTLGARLYCSWQACPRQVCLRASRPSSEGGRMGSLQ